MASRIKFLLFMGVSVSAHFFVDLNTDSYNPLARSILTKNKIMVSQNYSRSLCCHFTNAQGSCATNCVNQDCSATCTVRCGIFNSVCGTYTCSDVTSSCKTTTTTTATTSCVAAGERCLDTSGTSLGSCCPYLTCTVAPPMPGGAFCLITSG